MRFLTQGERVRGWIAAATDRAILGRSIATCLIVGALLTVINHGDQLLRGEFNSVLAWQVGLTFLVPFLVATSSGAAAIQSRANRRASSAGLDVESNTALRE
jgi:hypothetical protein